MQTTLADWKPSSQPVVHDIENLSSTVLSWMRKQHFFSNKEVDALSQVKVGKMRRNATQKHGVCRYIRGTDVTCPGLGPKDVDRIDIHPSLLCNDWWDYAKQVMYHEYLHALGHYAHDNAFFRLENAWDDPDRSRGKAFTELMRRANAKWLWVCSSCSKEYPRRKKSSGNYKCRSCNVVLKDVKID